MLEHSEHPSPSISSTPVTSRSRSATAPGRLSPDDTASRTVARASGSGWRSRKRASWSQNVGTPLSTVTRSRATVSRTPRGDGRGAVSTAVAPLPMTRKKPLPNPSDVNRRAIEWQRSPGPRPRTSAA